MSYHLKTKTALRNLTGKSGGTLLGLLAIRKGVSVSDIAAITGASRTTIYSWFNGGTISNAYAKPVSDLIIKIRNQ